MRRLAQPQPKKLRRSTIRRPCGHFHGLHEYKRKYPFKFDPPPKKASKVGYNSLRDRRPSATCSCLPVPSWLRRPHPCTTGMGAFVCVRTLSLTFAIDEEQIPSCWILVIDTDSYSGNFERELDRPICPDSSVECRCR
jgi:hypothetical protein